MAPVWVFQHLAAEPPGGIGTGLTRLGHTLRIVRCDAEPLPPPDIPAAALVVMGGPMAVYEAARYPWMTAELDWIRAALVRGLPVLGVCLGAQLLAAAAGADVHPGRAGPELGWGPVRLTAAGAADPLASALAGEAGGEAQVFHWHGDTFALPPGATLLAGSARYPHQAFRLGDNAYGFQFHFEVTAEIIADWLALWGEAVATAGLSPEALAAESARHLPGLARRGAALVAAFARLLPGGAQ